MQHPWCLLDSSRDHCILPKYLQLLKAVHVECIIIVSPLKPGRFAATARVPNSARYPSKHELTYQSTKCVQQIVVAPAMAYARFVQTAPVISIATWDAVDLLLLRNMVWSVTTPLSSLLTRLPFASLYLTLWRPQSRSPDWQARSSRAMQASRRRCTAGAKAVH